MNSVDPIKNKKKEIKLNHNLGEFHPKYAIMLSIGVDTGLRISDILKLRPKDIRARSGRFDVKEKKTGKIRNVCLSPETLQEIREYVKCMRLKQTDYLVFSTNVKKDKPLSRQQALKIITRISSKTGLKNIGTHSMRKTYAENQYALKNDLNALKNDFKHADIKTTRLYVKSLKNKKGGL